MCTISPRLVEVGRHPNIALLTDSDVLDVQGQAGSISPCACAVTRAILT